MRSDTRCSMIGLLGLPLLAAVVAISGFGSPDGSGAFGLSSSVKSANVRTITANATAMLTRVTVPDVVGKNYQDAQIDMGTVGSVTYRFVHNPTVFAGNVIAQSPAAGRTVDEGAAVTLTVSIGPAAVPGSEPCIAAALRPGPGERVSEMTGQHTLDVSLTNISRSTCVLSGYPVVKLLDAHGRALDFSYSHSGDGMTTGAKPSPIYLLPAGEAWARINKYRCDIAPIDTASTVVFELPDDGGSIHIIKPHYYYDYCQEAPSLTVRVSPFEPVEALLWPA
jgi:hypothetical protein